MGGGLSVVYIQSASAYSNDYRFDKSTHTAETASAIGCFPLYMLCSRLFDVQVNPYSPPSGMLVKH